MNNFLLSSVPVSVQNYDSSIIRNVFNPLELKHKDFDPKPNIFFNNKDWNELVDKFYENLIYIKNQSYIWNSIFPGIERYKWITIKNIKKIEVVDDILYALGENTLNVISSSGTGFEKGKIEQIITKSALDDFYELKDFTINEYKLFALEGNYVLSWEYPSLNFKGYFGGFGGPSEKNKFYNPQAIASNSEYIFVADTENKNLKIYNHDFQFRCRVAFPSRPTTIAINNNYIFVGSSESNKIYRFEICCIKNFKIIYIPEKFILKSIRNDSYQDGFLYIVSESGLAARYTQDGLFISYLRNLDNNGIVDLYKNQADVVVLGRDNNIVSYLDYSYKLSALIENQCSAIVPSAAYIGDDELNPSWIPYNSSLNKMYDDIACLTNSITSIFVGDYSYEYDSILSVITIPSIYDFKEEIEDVLYFGENDPFVWEVVARPWRIFYDEFEKMIDFYNFQTSANIGYTPSFFGCRKIKELKTSRPLEISSDVYPITLRELNPVRNKFSLNYFCQSGEEYITNECFRTWNAFNCLFDTPSASCATWGDVYELCDVDCFSGIKWTNILPPSCTGVSAIDSLVNVYTPNFSSVVVSRPKESPVTLYWNNILNSYNSLSGHVLTWYRDRWRYYLNDVLIENFGNNLSHPMSGYFLNQTQSDVVFTSNNNIFACWKRLLLTRNTAKNFESLFPIKYTDFDSTIGKNCVYENTNWILNYNSSLRVWDLSSKHYASVWIYPSKYNTVSGSNDISLRYIPNQNIVSTDFCLDSKRSNSYELGKTITLTISAI